METESLFLKKLDNTLLQFRCQLLSVHDLETALSTLIEADLDQVPLPGEGHTWTRWQTFIKLAAIDMSLCKLYEAHTDVLAILKEFHSPLSFEDKRWGIWASEPPGFRVTLDTAASGENTISGRKAWCSGAPILTDALVTCWNAKDQQQLVAVKLDQPGVQITNEGWYAVGMAGTQSVEVIFDQAKVEPIGDGGQYLKRPGFWQGAAGIAACWFGGVLPLADALFERCQKKEDPHNYAHLGAVEALLRSGRDSLIACAHWIDQHPQENAALPARRLRTIIEDVALRTLSHTHRALGAYPYCQSRFLARRLADLPVFLSQSHGERDLQALGKLVSNEEKPGWRS